MIKKTKPKDYKGQPRTEDGRFGRGKQTSRSGGRNVGNKNVAGFYNLPPIGSDKPKHRPGSARSKA